jgi:hypothetical protein
MKKYISILTIAAVWTLTACTKEHSCTCDITETVNGTGTTYTRVTTVGKTSADDAQQLLNCNSRKYSREIGSPSKPQTKDYEYKCELDK